MLIRLYLGISFVLTVIFSLLNQKVLFWCVPVWIGLFLVLLALSVVFLFFVSLFYLRRIPLQKDNSFCRLLSYHTMDCILTLFRFRLYSKGLECVPKEPFILVCNHLSRFDPMVSFVLLKGRKLGFISKKENMKIPIVGPITHRIGFVALDRENPLRAMRTIHSAAKLVSEKGFSLGIYPEGTRSQNGELLEFKTGAFVMAKKAKAPIVVSSICGTRDYGKNLPFRTTPVTFQVLNVISKETVQRCTPEELSQMCRDQIQTAI